jgi:hypothetical protein
LNTLLINGVDVTQSTTGLEDLSVLFGLNSVDRTVSYTSSGTFSVAGQGYLIVKETLTNLGLTLPAKLIIKGVGEINFQVTARNVKDCGCDAQIFLSDTDQDFQSYTELSQTIISDDNTALFNAGHFVRVPYCTEPNFIGYIMLIFYLWGFILVTILSAIASVFDDDIDLNTFGNFVLGCTKYHWAFNVSNTIGYYASKTGIGYSSSLLKSQWTDLHIMDAYGSTGRSQRKLNISDPPNEIINYTPPQILTELSKVFNADYRIIDGTLHFERIDWFPANAKQIIGEAIEEYCIESDPNQLFTNIRYDWVTDMADETSQQVTPFYSGRVDHNPGEFRSLRGTRNINPRFAVSRFVSDKWGDAFIRKWRSSTWVGDSFVHDLVLTNGQTTEMRLLDIQPGGGPWRYAKRRTFNPGPFLYQERLLFKTYNGNFGDTASNTLYENYFKIEDPKIYPRYFVDQIEITVKDVCGVIADIQSQGLNVFFQTDYGRAMPQEIEYNTKSSIFTLRNCTVWP